MYMRRSLFSNSGFVLSIPSVLLLMTLVEQYCTTLDLTQQGWQPGRLHPVFAFLLVHKHRTLGAFHSRHHSHTPYRAQSQVCIKRLPCTYVGAFPTALDPSYPYPLVLLLMTPVQQYCHYLQ